MVLQLPAQSHTFTEAGLHVDDDHSVLMRHVTGVPDVTATLSV